MNGNRASTAVDPTMLKGIKRASVKYEGGGGDAGELSIENDRLKTTVMILTQKLKMKEDDGKEELERLQSDLN